MKSNSCIVTYYNTGNYGTTLQAFALFKNIQKLGINCFLLRDVPINPILLKTKNNKESNFFNRVFRKIKKIIYRKKINYKSESINSFCNTHFSFISFSELSEVKKNISSFIVGSDQCWNPYSGVSQKSFLLDFVEKESAKKYSYASSFGTSTVPFQFWDLYDTLLSQFDKISVREKEGQKLIKEILGADSTVVADPVFLLNNDEWSQLATENLEQEPYILCYFLGDESSARKCARKIAKTTQCKIVYICSNSIDFKIDKKNEKHLFPNINDFLSLIKNAKMVLTDSYHGFCFSIIFQKKVFLSMRFDDRDCCSENSRFLSLLSILDFPKQNVFYKNKITYKAIKESPEINYPSIESKLNNFIKQSKDFLHKLDF